MNLRNLKHYFPKMRIIFQIHACTTGGPISTPTNKPIEPPIKTRNTFCQDLADETGCVVYGSGQGTVNVGWMNWGGDNNFYKHTPSLRSKFGSGSYPYPVPPETTPKAFGKMLNPF